MTITTEADDDKNNLGSTGDNRQAQQEQRYELRVPDHNPFTGLDPDVAADMVSGKNQCGYDT
jgi:hypothetical protein